MITIEPILIDLPETILGEKVILKPRKPGDGAMVHEAYTEDYSKFTEYMGFMGVDKDTPPTVQFVEKRVRQEYAQYILRDIEMCYNIFDKQNNCLGSFSFYEMNWYTGLTKMVGWLRPSARNKGYMTDAIKTMADFAFDQMDMKRVSTTVDEDNMEALALMDRVGFEQEGILKSGWVKHNKNSTPANMVIFAKLREQDAQQAA